MHGCVCVCVCVCVVGVGGGVMVGWWCAGMGSEIL